MLRAVIIRRRLPIAVLGLVALPAAVAVALPAAHAQPPAHPARVVRSARLDPSFGGGRGYVTTGVRGLEAVAYAETIAPAAKIVIAGQATNRQGQGQIVVARYLASGRLDRTFGSRGIFKTSFPTAKGPYNALAVRPQGRKLLVAGGYGLGSMLVMRLTTAGRLDRSFGARHTGYTTIAAGGTAQSLVVSRSGSILVGSSNENANGRPMVIARLTPGGRLDPRFGRRGLAQAAFWNLRLAASAGVTGLAVTRDGGVIGAGHLDYIGSDGHGSAGIIRLSSRGTPVTGFGTRGHVEVAFTKQGGGFAQWFPCGLTVDGRGRITTTGDGSTSRGAALLSARLTARGALDRTFGAGGRASTPGLSGFNTTTCGATTTSAGALTAGVSAAIVRLRVNGSPDTRFARGGVLRIRQPRGAAIQAVISSGSRALLVAGSAGNNMYLARYLVGEEEEEEAIRGHCSNGSLADLIVSAITCFGHRHAPSSASSSPPPGRAAPGSRSHAGSLTAPAPTRSSTSTSPTWPSSTCRCSTSLSNYGYPAPLKNAIDYPPPRMSLQAGGVRFLRRGRGRYPHRAAA